MAAAFFNLLAWQRDQEVRAASAGVRGAEPVSPITLRAMAETGVSLERHEPRLLSADAARSADRIIVLGCRVDGALLPPEAVPVEEWPLADPNGQPLEIVRAIRDAVRERVEALLLELDVPRPQGHRWG